MKSGSAAQLNACRVTTGNGVIYSMSLLAFCGFHQRKKMVDFLLKEGAGIDVTRLSSRVNQITLVQVLYIYTYTQAHAGMHNFIHKGVWPLQGWGRCSSLNHCRTNVLESFAYARV